MDLNRTIPRTGSAIVTVTVFLFAIFQIINFSMGSFFACFILPIGFIMMTAGLHNECESDRKVTANIGMVFAAVYCMLIMLVYFTQLTTVNNEQLTEQAAKLSIDNIKVKTGMPADVDEKLMNKCKAPTLVMAAEKDCLFPGEGVIRRAARIIPNCRTYLLKGRGHMNFLTEEEKKMIVDFLLG